MILLQPCSQEIGVWQTAGQEMVLDSLWLPLGAIQGFSLVLTLSPCAQLKVLVLTLETRYCSSPLGIVRGKELAEPIK
jgi:hypothetical protein